MTRFTSRSDGLGRPLTALIADWAAGSPRIRRVWLFAAPSRNIALTMELQPVADSEETLAVWMAHCEQWRRQLQDRIGEPVDLDWHDPDSETKIQADSDEGRTLVYERAS